MFVCFLFCVHRCSLFRHNGWRKYSIVFFAKLAQKTTSEFCSINLSMILTGLLLKANSKLVRPSFVPSNWNLAGSSLLLIPVGYISLGFNVAMLTTKLHFMLLITAELTDQTRRSFLLNFIRGVDSALDLSDFTGNAGIRILNGPC